MHKKIKWALFSFFLALPILGYSEENKAVYVVLEGSSDLEVLYHRAASTATGAALAGLIGAAVQASAESGKDNAKKAEIEPHLPADLWQKTFYPALTEKLESKGYTVEFVEDGKAAKAGEGIVVTIDEDIHGLRAVDTSKMLVSAFVQFKASIGDGEKAQKGQAEDYYLTNRVKRPFEEFATDGTILRADLEKIINKSAKRLANKIIYQ